jgi:hypothetical protein
MKISRQMKISLVVLGCVYLLGLYILGLMALLNYEPKPDRITQKRQLDVIHHAIFYHWNDHCLPTRKFTGTSSYNFVTYARVINKDSLTFKVDVYPKGSGEPIGFLKMEVVRINMRFYNEAGVLITGANGTFFTHEDSIQDVKIVNSYGMTRELQWRSLINPLEVIEPANFY